MDDVGKENLDFNAAISDPAEIRPDTQGASGLADAGGQREKFPSGKKTRMTLAALAAAGGIAGCKVVQEKFTPTPVVKRVVYVEPTATERPRVVETVFGPGREPTYITGGLTGTGMGGPGGISEAIEAHEGDIGWIKTRVNAEAFKSAEVAEVSPRLWTPFLNPKEEMVIGFGEKGVLGIVMPKDGKGKATQAYKLEKIGDITPLTTGKMEYFCFPGSSFEPVTENGDKPIEGLMRLREREAEKILDIYEIDPKMDALEVVLGVRMAKRLPNGEFAKDEAGKYVFEGEKEKAIVILTSSADGMTQSVTVMKGELFPVEGKLKEGIIAQFDYSMMRCVFSQKNSEGVMERMALTYDPFTGKWEGGVKEQVVEPVKPREIDQFESVYWTADEMDQKIASQEQRTGRLTIFWPIEVMGAQDFGIEPLHLSLYGAPRFYMGFDVPTGKVIRSPISGEIIIPENDSHQILIDIRGRNGKAVSFWLKSMEGVRFKFDRDPATGRGRIRVGEPLFEITGPVEKINRIGRLTPDLETPRTFALDVSNLDSQQYSVDFDWLKADDGAIACSAPPSK